MDYEIDAEACLIMHPVGDCRISDVLFNVIKHEAVKLCKHLTHHAYIELWDEAGFRSYFTHGNDILKQPVGPDKPVEGFHDYVEENYIMKHNIAIIMNENWSRTLRHEMFHAVCAEFIGKVWWDQLGDMYKEYRRQDPFEATAIIVADPEIAGTIKLEGKD